MAATDQLQFFGGRKNAKIGLVIFFKFQHHIPSNMLMCDCFFKDATKIQNGRQKSTPKIFVGAKTLKLQKTSESIQILQSHSPQYGDVQVIF